MKNGENKQIVVYDIRGQICPSCLLFTLREMNEQRTAIKDGRIQILIKTDNRDAITTIPEAVSSMGYAHMVEKIDGYYEIRILRNDQ